MAKETRKRFLRSTVAEDIQEAMNAVANASAAMGDGLKALAHLEKALKKLQDTNKLASQEIPGYRPMPAQIRNRLETLQVKMQETVEMVRKWAVTKDERALQKGGKPISQASPAAGQERRPRKSAPGDGIKSRSFIGGQKALL
ncbi:MAG: hypothetical protein Q7R34_06570 [Dehalococcoidia bacterium]|nr:hypothetical protein [Dehalococcoidia bacterium]